MPQTAVLSGNEQSTTASPTDKLDIMVKDLAAQAGPFARMPITEKIALLEQCLPRLEAVAARWVRRACEAKGLDFDSGPAAEEWLGGPVCTIRNTRLLIDSLKEIANTGAPAFGRGRVERDDDRVELKVFPTSTLDSALFTGFSGTLLFQDGLTESDIRAKQGEFYKKPHEGGVSLILGAGNVASIPPMDALYKSFVEGFVCVIKMNPVNEYLGPFFEEAFRPLIERNIWGVAFGGATEGRFLVEHDDVVDIHITGSDRTHDMIVWGPPGEERERRMKENDPVLKKRITSELGNVTPVVIVPGKYSPAELAFLAHNVASMVTNNGSFNCNAAKMIVLSKGWPQRDAFMSAVKTTLDSAPPRRAYYPGAGDRYEKLTEGRENVWKARGEREDGLQWAVIEHVDASDEEEALFQVEPFCGIISETALDPEDPAAFTDAATAFCNDRLWGTLSMTIAYPSAIEKNDTFQSALNRAIKELRYGTVAINQWSALCYGFVSPAWGGHPSATLKDIQSGLGWVHNTYMFEGIDKTVIRGPHIVKPKPPWFVGHKTAHEIGRKLVALEARPSFFKVPGVVLSALFG